jgi:hypothetical protein
MLFRFRTLLQALLFSAALLLPLSGCGGGGGAAAAPTYSVSGKVVNSSNVGVSGVKVNLVSGTPKLAKSVASTVIASTVTDVNGTYTFTTVPAGQYSIASDDLLYGFSPVPVTVSTAALSVPQLVAHRVFSISGTIRLAGGSTPLAGLTVNLAGDTTSSQTTGTDGVYTFSGLSSGSYTVTPTGTTYAFVPGSISSIAITDQTGNVTGQDFTASVPTFALSGTVTVNGTGIAGVAVNLTASNSSTVLQSTTSGNGGSYSFTSVPNGSYTISSADAKYGFPPVSVTVNGSAVTGLQCVAYPVFTISGTISKDGAPQSGATVTLYKTTFSIYEVPNFPGHYGTGTPVLLSSGTVIQTTGSDGAYSFTGIRSGSYTIVPTQTGLLFNPEKTNVISITDSGNAYGYDPTITGNLVTPDHSIIYNSTITITDNKLAAQNFTASIPGGGGVNF